MKAIGRPELRAVHCANLVKSDLDFVGLMTRTPACPRDHSAQA
jgi:hypothetical protein